MTRNRRNRRKVNVTHNFGESGLTPLSPTEGVSEQTRRPFANLPSTEFVPPLGGGDIPWLPSEAISEIVAQAQETEPQDVRRAQLVLDEYDRGIRKVPEEQIGRFSEILKQIARELATDGEAPSLQNLRQVSQDLMRALATYKLDDQSH